MKRLWVRLSLAFALVVLIGIAIAMLLMNRQVDAGFRRYLAYSQTDSALTATLARYFETAGNWQGVEQVFGDSGNQRGRRQGAPKRILADADGAVVFDETSAHGPALSRQEQAAALPIRVDGQTVGYLYVTAQGRGLAAAEQAFLAQVNRALLAAGLLAAGLGILAGLLFARRLAAPLGRLAAAARNISGGDLSARVPVQGSQEVAEVSQAFNDMAADLEQAETLRRNLVADIAHELRTPLTVIQGNLQAILDGVYPLDRDEIAVIHDESLVLSRLIADLRELSQAEAGQLSLDPQPVAAQPLLEGMIGLFREQALAHEIDLRLDPMPDLPTIYADPDRLRQVLYNLLGNALRHTSTGGVVTLRAEPVDGRDNKPLVRFSVLDSGPGIPPEELPYVFGRFWRAERSRSRESGGSGLGLAIARQLIEAQGGEIGAESESGRGSCFWFSLPTSRTISNRRCRT